MSPEELEKFTKNLKWLETLVPTLPDLAFIEPTVQSLALINHSNKFSNDLMIMIGVAGFIATKARVVDESRFQDITPTEYLHHAYILLKLSRNEEPSESEYSITMNNLYKYCYGKI
jgi:hypothetical protein